MSGRVRLLVTASTFPSRRGDGTPAFVSDLSLEEARYFDTVALVPRVAEAKPAETWNDLEVRRFRYFPQRWEDLADGAILDNLRARPSRWLQVIPFIVAETIAMRRLIRTFRPDVLHVHWMIPQGISARLAKGRLPMVLTTLGGDVYALESPFSRMLKRWVLRGADAVTAPNRDMRNRLIGLGANPETTTVQPMGADTDPLRGLVRSPREPGRILFCGRLVEKKGVRYLLEALRRLPADAEWRLHIVGDGPLRPELERDAQDLGERVRFHGQLGREELREHFATCQVFALPSVTAASGDQDGLPVVLLEAMAAGCAIVASRLPGIDEALVDGQSAILVPPGDPPELAQALQRLLADGDYRSRLAENAAAEVDRFSVATTGEAFASLILGVVEGRSGQAAASRSSTPRDRG